MLKYGGDAVHAALYRVILGIWRTEQAPQDFKQDILLPIPKKGDASLCSNHRTIALQSIAGKAYANVLSARLSEWLADNLLDEQCGFRPSRSTVDALFSLRLLCNGAWDKAQTLHICMLDLTKAFDSVDREMAWQILLSRGAPPKLVALIRDLHTHHPAVIRSEVDSAPVGISVGFKQGCVLAPPLFNVCLDSVIRQLQPQLQQLGVTICYKIDGQLMHCKKPTEEVLMWILMYADDISLACDTAEKLRVAVTTMDATFLRWEVTISTKKTKVLVVGRNAAAQAAESVITLRGDRLEVVSQFKYLGSVFNSDCTLDAEITHRVTAANSAFQQLRRVNIWSSRALTLFVKMQFFQCIVMSVLLYSGETWAVVKQHISPLAVFQMNCLRRVCGISLRDHVPNVDILNRCNTLSVESQLQGKRLRWLGHVFRMPNDRLPKKLLFGQVKGLRPPGRPRSSFNDVALHDCQTRRIGRPYRDAQDRLLWKDKTCPART